MMDIDRVALMLDEPTVFYDWKGLEGDDTGTEEGNAAGKAVGQVLYDLEGNWLGRLTMAPLGQLSGSRNWRDWVTPRPAIIGVGGVTPFKAGSYLMNAGQGKLYHVTLNNKGNIIKSATSTMSIGSTGSAPAWSSTRGAWQEQSAWQAEQDRLNAERQAERDRIAAENAEKMNLQNRLTELSTTAASIQRQASADLYALEEASNQMLGQTMGQDVWRGAAMATGQTPRGRTAMQGYRQNVGQTAASAGQRARALDRPLRKPNLGADIAGLEAQIPYYEQMMDVGSIPQMPTQPIWGMAGGGSFPGAIEGEVLAVDGIPQAGGPQMGSPSMGMSPMDTQQQMGAPQMGSTKEAILIGEGPSTHVEPGTEVAVYDRATGGAEIIPLKGGAAQGMSFDWETGEQTLAPLWSYMGMSGPVKVQKGALGTQRLMGGAPGGLQAMQKLGVQPRLIRNRETGGVYYMENGVRRPVPADIFKQAKWQWGDVLDLPGAAIGRLGPMGSRLEAPPPIVSPETLQTGTQWPGLIVAPTSTRAGEEYYGYAMPDIAASARFWSQLLPSLSPAVQTSIMSAYGMAGWTPEMIQHRAAMFTPSGTASRAGVRYG